MKPLQLELQAFGPFARRQVIDFRQLGGKTFFLIHGPTGSGKTSILDGICFALFGDSSGGERDGRQMRSHHADADTPTEVSFDFALGDQRYRVRRVPLRPSAGTALPAALGPRDRDPACRGGASPGRCPERRP
jgi:exonuclease SbcC